MAIVLVMLVASTAGAHPHATIYVSPQNAQPGQSVTLTGVRFWGAVGQATIEWADGTVIGTAPVDADGNWTYSFVLPQAVDDRWRLAAIAYDATGQPIQNSADPIAVTGPEAPGPPPAEATGAPSAPPTAVTTPAGTTKPAALPTVGHSSQPSAGTLLRPSHTRTPRSHGLANKARDPAARTAPIVTAIHAAGTHAGISASRGGTAPRRAVPTRRGSTLRRSHPGVAGRRGSGSAQTEAPLVGANPVKSWRPRHNTHRSTAWRAIPGLLLLVLLCAATGGAWLGRHRLAKPSVRGDALDPLNDPIEAELQALLASERRSEATLTGD